VIYPEIAELVAHQPPMRLLDKMVDAKESSVTCEVTLHSGSIFVQRGYTRAVVSLEYMAQCVAVYAGYRRLQAGGKSRIGYLVSARDVILETDVLAAGDKLLVHAEHVWGKENAASFRCWVKRGAETIATATLSVFQPE
jgi:predicted hotdog family 3-hydroxylacyl-ACP dehydratase